MAQETQTSITQIRKRDGRVVPFDKEKIANAIFRAAKEVGGDDREKADQLASLVVSNLESKFTNPEKFPSVEEVQDTVEKVLIDDGHAKTAKAYIIYRHKHAEIRRTKELLGVNDDLKLPVNTIKVLASRYLIKDENGKIIETPKELFWRAAKNVAAADKLYGRTDEDVEATAKEFYDMMTNSEFMPNSPTLMNAGTRLGQLSACFVIPVGDSIEEIFDAVKYQAIIHKTGGGTGFAFSRLRPKGDRVRGTFGVSSGPVSFMKIFDAATAEVKQGGKRRGANMGILRIDHPDILEFIMMKEREGVLANFNISCAITDKFIQAMRSNEDYELINPRNNSVTGKLNARAIWNLIVTMAWKTGDPGVIFIDRINNTVSNPVPSLGPVESTNPCVTGDTLVSTNSGLRTIKELAENSVDLNIATNMPNGNQQLLSFRKAKAFKTGRKEIFRLKTESGYEVTATADHRFLTKDGWKELKDLTVFNELILQNSEGAFNKDITLPATFGDKKEWDIELGRTIGWLIGDGWLVDKKNLRVGFTFGNDDKEIFKYLRPVINGLYGFDIKEVERPNGVLHLSYHSKYFVEFFKKLGVKAWQSATKEVPASIFTATKEAVVGFLQGLFSSDGTVGYDREKGNYYIRLTSKSEKLLKQAQLLLLNLGVKSKIYERHRERRVTFQYKTIKGELKLYEDSGLLWELHISRDMVPLFIKKIGFLCNKNAEKLKKIENVKFHKTIFVDRVFSKESAGFDDVYDLTEPETHSFVANGMIVHNCGEQPLYPYDSCNLGSINLGKMVKEGEVDWEKLRTTVRRCVHFLDNVIDANKYPLIEIELMSKKVRRIGLGVMGFADMLILLGIPYNSPYALKVAESVMKFISDEGRQMSVELAKERGSFPEFKNSVWAKMGYEAMRNSTVTTIAPTGTISIIAGGCSQGIEPLFSIAYVRAVGGSLGHDLVEVSPLFERIAIQEGFYSEDLIKKISQLPSIQNVQEIPADLRRLFVTAFDLLPEWHVRIQAAFQKYTDNAVSKTINFPNSATPYDVEKAYMLAYDLACKGITIYRDGSKSFQVLNVGGKPQEVSVPIGESGMIEYREQCEGCNM